MAVCSILYQLATRPLEQEKMFSELKKIFPDPKSKITSKNLDELHYTKGFIREVFRMYSTVIGNGRTLQQDTVIGGYQIPKGVSFHNHFSSDNKTKRLFKNKKTIYRYN